jgi:hypothetical protein
MVKILDTKQVECGCCNANLEYEMFDIEQTQDGKKYITCPRCVAHVIVQDARRDSSHYIASQPDKYVPAFASQGWWRIKDSGWVCLVECDQERTRDHNQCGLIGQSCTIDGEEFIVHGIEMNMPATPISKGERIGLLVREKIAIITGEDL